MADELVLNEAQMTALGNRLGQEWEMYRDDRKSAEEHWLQNLRQFRGVYDPEMARLIPNDRSKAYPKLTRWKCIGTVARLMQMLFPQTEKNWALQPSPMPNLSREQLQTVLDALVAKKAQAQSIDPAQVECSDEEIEKAILDYATARAERMALKISDDLAEMEFITLARRVVFSAVLYNVGVLEGPMHMQYPVRTWAKDQFTGKYTATDSVKLKPLFEFLPVWEWYPDMTAKTLDKQDGYFRRRIQTRRQVEDLAKRPDFLKDNIMQWLARHRDGNWKSEAWETQLQSEKKSDQTSVGRRDSKKYIVLSYWGDVTGHELRACGADIADDDLGKTFTGNVWLLDKTVIKAKVAVIDDPSLNHHVFVFEEDDLSLLGNGQCDTLRDSQLSLSEMTRMLLDEASVGGENLLIFPEMLEPGQSHNIASHKVWKQEGQGQQAMNPAVRPVARQSRVADLLTGVKTFLEFANNESGLPPPSLGDTSQGGSEALRTQANASMFLGAAALPIRDTVRNYDTFTTSVISALMKWNMKYDPNTSRDGDYQALGRGSTSLIAKEVLANSLDQFRTTLSPEEQAHLNVRKMLEIRAKARDIPIEDVLLPIEEAEANVQAMHAAQSKLQELQSQEVEAKVHQIMADALKKVAEAHKADASVSMDAFNLLLEVFNGGGKSKTSGAGAAAGAAP